MNKKTTVSINHPQLLKFRNNLRQLLHMVVLSELERLREDQGDATLSEKQYKLLNNEKSILRLAWKQSICTCSLCGSRVSNMTYNANEGYWFCDSCYLQRHNFYEQKAKEGQIWLDGGGRPSTTWFP